MKKQAQEIVIYQSDDWIYELEVYLQNNDIWLTQKKMWQIFGVDTDSISYHLQNIYSWGELQQDSTTEEISVVQREGKRNVSRTITHYNLDAIISVGYRVNSLQATKFRQRATQTLRQHITQWFTINHNKIQQNYETFLRAVEDIKQLNYQQILPADEVLELIRAFGKTWFSLDAFDKQIDLTQPRTVSDIKIEANKLYGAVGMLKNELLSKWQATDLFAQEKTPWALEGIFANIFQSAFWEDVYPSIESKATHLLYFVVKNHPFTDGNKRTWAFAFIWFLQQAGYRFTASISPEALTALTLLVAASAPEDKEKVVGLIILLQSPSV